MSTFAESTAGVADGAKTGLASLVTGRRLSKWEKGLGFRVKG